MANEITVSASLKVSNGNFELNKSSGFKQFDQTGSIGGNPGTVNISTSDEVINLGDITTPGWFFAQNLDETNYVELGPESASSMIPAWRLEPGEFTLGRLSPVITLRGQANTAAVNVLLLVLED